MLWPKLHQIISNISKPLAVIIKIIIIIIHKVRFNIKQKKSKINIIKQNNQIQKYKQFQIVKNKH